MVAGIVIVRTQAGCIAADRASQMLCMEQRTLQILCVNPRLYLVFPEDAMQYFAMYRSEYHVSISELLLQIQFKSEFAEDDG